MTSYLVTIDPGVRGCGVAFAIDGVIRAAEYVVGEKDTKVTRAGAWLMMAKAVRQWWLAREPSGQNLELVIELPQIYKDSHQVGSKSRVDKDDLVNLAATVGAVVQALNTSTVVYLPCEWKGQVPKEIMHERAQARLTVEELVVIQKSLPGAKLAHNVWDAVAMSLKHTGRW